MIHGFISSFRPGGEGGGEGGGKKRFELSSFLTEPREKGGGKNRRGGFFTKTKKKKRKGKARGGESVPIIMEGRKRGPREKKRRSTSKFP